MRLEIIPELRSMQCKAEHVNSVKVKDFFLAVLNRGDLSQKNAIKIRRFDSTAIFEEEEEEEGDEYEEEEDKV